MKRFSKKQKPIPSPQSQSGVTLIELLFALPIATLISIILMGTLFVQYTNSLAESARSNLRSSGQTLLINLQDELLFTIAYGEQLNTSLTDEYESDSSQSGTWRHDSDPQTLIINEIALDSTRRDEDRNIVRRRTNDCASSRITDNSVAINNVIYFIQDNPDSNYNSLMKRIITPTYDLCGIDSDTGDPCEAGLTPTCSGNSKTATCPEAEVGINDCTQADSTLTDKVIDMEIKYFAENNVITPFPSAADKVEIILTMGDKVYGKEVETEVKHTIRKIN